MTSDPAPARSRQSTRLLLVCGAVMTLAFALTAFLAPRLDVSDVEATVNAWCVFEFVGALVVAGLAWATACWLVVRRNRSTRGFWIITGFAVVFRAFAFGAPPILELDVYRYLWDGFVSVQGVDPYAYSPAEASEAHRFGDLEPNADLRRLATALDHDSTARTVLDRVHYPTLTTIYPPVAQWVFKNTVRAFQGGSVADWVFAMKSVFGVGECIMLLLVGVALKLARRPLTWLVIPAWCPLIIVSIWNQAHLDVLPAAPALGAVLAALVFPPISASIASAALLALASGMKIYPILLAPLVAVYIARRSPTGRRAGALTLFGAVFVVVSLILWKPLIDRWRGETDGAPRSDIRQDGFKAFAWRWEMYDSFFAVVEGNLTPTSIDNHSSWYVVVPHEIRGRIPDPQKVARVIWLGTTALLSLVFAMRIWRNSTTQTSLESAFLLLIWFWALSPVCNPWYLVWAAPFLPFAANPGWLLLYALAPALYLRFGLAAQFGPSGENWFDNVGVFAFTGTWLIVVVACAWRRYRLESISTGTIALSDPDRNPSRSTLT